MPASHRGGRGVRGDPPPFPDGLPPETRAQLSKWLRHKLEEETRALTAILERRHQEVVGKIASDEETQHTAPGLIFHSEFQEPDVPFRPGAPVDEHCPGATEEDHCDQVSMMSLSENPESTGEVTRISVPRVPSKSKQSARLSRPEDRRSDRKQSQPGAWTARRVRQNKTNRSTVPGTGSTSLPQARPMSREPPARQTTKELHGAPALLAVPAKQPSDLFVGTIPAIPVTPVGSRNSEDSDCSKDISQFGELQPESRIDTPSKSSVDAENGRRKSSMIRTSYIAFPDEGQLKEKARRSVWQGEYTVERFCSNYGWAQNIARHPKFAMFQVAIIVLNSIWIGIEADNNKEEVLFQADWGFIFVEQVFTLVFFSEWIIRLLAFDRKVDTIKDFWFCFDSLLLLSMVLETWVFFIATAMYSSAGGASLPTSMLVVLRLSRLSRTARSIRLLSNFQDVWVLIKGVKDAAQTVTIICILLVVLVYIFAVLFYELARQTKLSDPDGAYRDVPTSMLSLMMGGLLADAAPMTYLLANVDVVMAPLFVLFVLLGSLMIMNMVVGVLVQVVGTIATVETERKQLNHVKSVLLSALHCTEDMVEEALVSEQDIVTMLSEDHVVGQLQALSIDGDELLLFSSKMMEEREHMKLHELWDLALQLRGNNSARVKDLMHMRQFLQSELESMSKSLVDQISSKIGWTELDE